MFGKNYSFVCFGCRRSIKAQFGAVCPECGEPMRNMGDAFKAPRRESANQWRKLKLLALAGYKFWSHDRTQAIGPPNRRSRGGYPRWARLDLKSLGDVKRALDKLRRR